MGGPHLLAFFSPPTAKGRQHSMASDHSQREQDLRCAHGTTPRLHLFEVALRRAVSYPPVPHSQGAE